MKVSKLIQQSYIEFNGITTPLDSPAVGNIRLYAKDDGEIYTQDSSGNESPISKHPQSSDSIPASESKIVESIELSKVKSVKYLLYFSTVLGQCSYEVLAINKTTYSDYMVYGIVGDYLNIDVTVTTDATNLNINVINNELDVLNVMLIRSGLIG